MGDFLSVLAELLGPDVEVVELIPLVALAVISVQIHLNAIRLRTLLREAEQRDKLTRESMHALIETTVQERLIAALPDRVTAAIAAQQDKGENE